MLLSEHLLTGAKATRMARPVSISNDTILAAARRVFLKHGYQAGTAQVAREAGVSEGSLFKHFKTKESLFLSAMEVESREHDWENRLMQSVGRGDMRATMEDVGLRILRHLQVIMPCIMLVNASGVTFTRTGPCEADPPPLRLIRMLTRYFRAEVRTGRLDMAAPAIQAHVFVGAISHYVFCERVFNYRSGPASAYMSTVVDTILGTPAGRRRPGVHPELTAGITTRPPQRPPVRGSRA